MKRKEKWGTGEQVVGTMTTVSDSDDDCIIIEDPREASKENTVPREQVGFWLGFSARDEEITVTE